MMDTTVKSGKVPLRFGRRFIAAGLLLSSLAGAEPVKFDWRFNAQKDGVLPQEPAAQAKWDTAPNPVVLPIPEPPEQDDRTTGWRWLKPRLARSPGSDSNRIAVQLANAAQEADMARLQSPLNGFLPESLGGLVPMAVESGIEWRF
jgi:hypothetical protein